MPDPRSSCFKPSGPHPELHTWISPSCSFHCILGTRVHAKAHMWCMLQGREVARGSNSHSYSHCHCHRDLSCTTCLPCDVSCWLAVLLMTAALQLLQQPSKAKHRLTCSNALAWWITKVGSVATTCLHQCSVSSCSARLAAVVPAAGLSWTLSCSHAARLLRTMMSLVCACQAHHETDNAKHCSMSGYMSGLSSAVPTRM